jgi:hypothetical protein
MHGNIFQKGEGSSFSTEVIVEEDSDNMILGLRVKTLRPSVEYFS